MGGIEPLSNKERSEMSTYTKLNNGNWGVRVDGKAEAGQTVSVRTKAGELKQETIERVLWTGADKQTGRTVSLCAIAQRGGGYSRGRSSGGRGYSSAGGSAASVPGYSSYCTGRSGCGCYDCAS